MFTYLLSKIYSDLFLLEKQTHIIAKKCTLPISESQSFLQCKLCKRNNCFEMLVNLTNNPMQTINTEFTSEDCSRCIICSRKVARNHKAIARDLCNCLIHIKCSKLSNSDYEKFKINLNWNFTRLSCNRLKFPFFIKMNNDQKQLS